MFDEFLRDCPMEDKLEPSKKRVKKNIAALNSLIETEEGTVTRRRFRLERLLVAAVMTIISLSLITVAYAASQTSVIKFVMCGIEIEGEYYDYVDKKGFRHISFSAELPIDEENYAIIYDVDAPRGENVHVITEETDPDFMEKLRLYSEQVHDHYAEPEEFGLVFKDSELCEYNLFLSGNSGSLGCDFSGILGEKFMHTEANCDKPSGFRREFSYDHENGIKIFEEAFYYYVGKEWQP